MAGIGPVGSMIYTNQNMQAAATKQTSQQNRVDMQNLIASASANEQGKEVRQIRPTEETHKIDPEKQHQKEKREQESGAKEEETTRDTKHKQLKESEQDETPPTTILDITV